MKAILLCPILILSGTLSSMEDNKPPKPQKSKSHKSFFDTFRRGGGDSRTPTEDQTDKQQSEDRAINRQQLVLPEQVADIVTQQQASLSEDSISYISGKTERRKSLAIGPRHTRRVQSHADLFIPDSHTGLVFSAQEQQMNELIAKYKDSTHRAELKIVIASLLFERVQLKKEQEVAIKQLDALQQELKEEKSTNKMLFKRVLEFAAVKQEQEQNNHN